MKNTKKLKQVLVTSALLLGTLMIGSTSSQAALQANPATHSAGEVKTGASWLSSIRQMEAIGNTMGLTETINSALVSTSGSNNIDVHMMKSTEYGAMAILSASGFGYSGKLQDAPIKSTTGNVTGVYVPGDRWEWTASVNRRIASGENIYYNYYSTSQASAKIGDALGTAATANPGCSGWHGASSSWISDNSGYGFIRGGQGIFAYTGHYSTGNNWTSSKRCGRGVAVVGTGL